VAALAARCKEEKRETWGQIGSLEGMLWEERALGAVLTADPEKALHNLTRSWKFDDSISKITVLTIR
jgi:hypothetical protein